MSPAEHGGLKEQPGRQPTRPAQRFLNDAEEQNPRHKDRGVATAQKAGPGEDQFRRRTSFEKRHEFLLVKLPTSQARGPIQLVPQQAGQGPRREQEPNPPCAAEVVQAQPPQDSPGRFGGVAERRGSHDRDDVKGQAVRSHVLAQPADAAGHEQRTNDRAAQGTELSFEGEHHYSVTR